MLALSCSMYLTSSLFVSFRTKNLLFYSDRVAIGRSLDLPVYFGDAGSREVRVES